MGHGHTLSFPRNEMHLDADLAATVRPIFFITVPMESRICNRAKNDFFTYDTKYDVQLGDAVTIAGVGDVRTYGNIGRARIHGVESGSKIAVAPKVTATANWTFLTRQIKNGTHAGQPLRSTPKQAVNVQLDWMPTAATDVWLSAQYRSGMYRSKQAAVCRAVTYCCPFA